MTTVQAAQSIGGTFISAVASLATAIPPANPSPTIIAISFTLSPFLNFPSLVSCIFNRVFQLRNGRGACIVVDFRLLRLSGNRHVPHPFHRLQFHQRAVYYRTAALNKSEP